MIPRLRTAPKISLQGQDPFARGSNRLCYIHPDDPDMCVKVVADTTNDRCHAEQILDLEDFAALQLRGENAVFDRIPTIEYLVETELGVGIVMQLYRDADGQISRNLVEVIRERGMSRDLVNAIIALKAWLKEHRIRTRDVDARNIVAIDLGGGQWKLVIIEAWLNRRHRWLARIHPLFEDRLIERQLHKFDRRLAALIGTCQEDLYSSGRSEEVGTGGH